MTTLNLQVEASTDDCFVYWDGGAWQIKALTDVSIGVGWFSAAYAKQGGGMRFTGLTIPSSAVITSAYLTFRCNSAKSTTTVNSKIRGEKNNNASTFSTAADYIGRTRTTASVNWNSIPAWLDDTDYISPNIATIIQELVDFYGGLSLANIVLFWGDHDDGSTHSADTARYAWSWDGSADLCPKLQINYPTHNTVASSLSLGIAPNITRKTVVSRTGNLILGNSVDLNRKTVISRSSVNTLGNSVSLSRGITISRSSENTLGTSISVNKGISKLLKATLGLSLSVARKTSIFRTSNNTLGLYTLVGLYEKIKRRLSTVGTNRDVSTVGTNRTIINDSTNRNLEEW